jgi:hypothetical protein
VFWIRGCSGLIGVEFLWNAIPKCTVWLIYYALSNVHVHYTKCSMLKQYRFDGKLRLTLKSTMFRSNPHVYIRHSVAKKLKMVKSKAFQQGYLLDRENTKPELPLTFL